MTTIDIYFGMRLIKAMLGVFITVFMLVFTLEFVEWIRKAGDAVNASAGAMARLSIYRTPSIVERILPFAVLFGAMMAYLNLSRKLELVVARAAGISVWQFLRPGIVVAGVMGVLAVVAYNPLSASLRQRAIDLENQLFPRASASKEEVVWLGQRSETGNGVIRAGAVLDGGKALTDATFFLFHADGRFRERVSAERADLVGLQWRLSGVRVFPADAPPFQEETRTIATNLRPDYIRRTYTSPESVSFWRLRAEAVESEAMGLDGTRYTLQFQRLLSQPLLLIAMVIIASTVSLRFFRMGGVAKGVALGIAAGFVLYIVKKLVEDLGSVGMLDTAFAAWFPAAVACLAGSTVLLHLEDG